MKARKHSIVTVLIFIVVIGGIALYLALNPELLTALSHLTLPIFLLLVALRLLFLLLNGVMLNLFVSQFGIKLVWQEWTGLALATTLGNYLTPFSGGMIARATYLKMRHKLPYSQFASLLTASYIVSFSATAVIGLICLIWLNTWAWNSVLIAVFLLLVLIAAGLLVNLPLHRLPLPNNRLGQLLMSALTGWQLIRQNMQLLWGVLLISLVGVVLNGAAFWLAYQAIGLVEVSIPAAMLVSLTAVFSILVTITPGNIGVREAIISLMSQLLGVGVGEGLLVALIIRIGTLSTVFTLGPLFTVYLTQRLNEAHNADS